MKRIYELLNTDNVSLNYIFTLLIVIYVFLLRFVLLGGVPMTDEGFYAFYAQYFYNNLTQTNPLHVDGMLMLYPLIVSWVFAFDVNNLILLRAIDMMVAIAASIIFYRVNLYFSQNKLLSFSLVIVFSGFLVNPLYIDNGFKNPINIGFLFLISGFYLAVNFKRSVNYHLPYFLSGLFILLAVLFRESMVFFAFIMYVLALILVKRKEFLLLSFLGGASCLSLLLVYIYFYKCGLVGFVESYRLFSSSYSFSNKSVFDSFISSFGIFMNVEAAGIFLFVVSFFLLKIKKFDIVLAGIFFLLILSFVEPLFKLSFPYHFSMLMFSMSVFLAYSYRLTRESTMYNNKFISMLTLVVALFTGSKILFGVNLEERYFVTRDVLTTFKQNVWPNYMVENSNYLQAAKMINEYKHDGMTLSVGGFMYILYPLTGLLPPHIIISNLTETVYYTKFSTSDFDSIVLLRKPDIVLTTKRKDWVGSEFLNHYFSTSREYHKVDELTKKNNISYGGFEGDLYLSRM